MTKQEQDTVTFFFFFFVFVLFYFSLYFYNCVPRRKKIVAVNRNFATEDAVGFFSVAFASPSPFRFIFLSFSLFFNFLFSFLLYLSPPPPFSVSLLRYICHHCLPSILPPPCSLYLSPFLMSTLFRNPTVTLSFAPPRWITLSAPSLTSNPRFSPRRSRQMKGGDQG